MILIIGGYSQGKLKYAKKNYSVCDAEIFDFEKNDLNILKDNSEELLSSRQIVFNNINSLIKREINYGKSPFDLMKKLLDNYPNSIIITDEIGNGIVPIDKNERLLREKIGRVQCMLAEQADEVIKVICGIGHKIK